MKKIISFSLTTFFLLFLALIFPKSAFAAKFSLNPLSKDINIGSQFDVSINLDTQSKEVEAAQAVLSFDKDLIEITRVSFSGIFAANYQNINNGNGYVQVGSNMESPGASFNGNSNWVTLTIKGKAKGSTELRFSCSESAIFEIETHNNLLDCGSLGAGSYTISEEDQPPAPTATPTPEPGGNGGPPGPGPGCTDLSPSTPTNLSAASGLGTGEVTLAWTKVSADYYSLVFGGASGAYEYGAANIGDTNQYVVRQLTPGKLYYFVVSAVRGCASSGFSNEASARAKGATGGPPPAKVTIGPTPTLPYQPIGEILPEVDFPTEEEVMRVTPIPIYEPEEKGPSPLRTILLILAFLAILVGLGFGLWKLVKGKMPPSPPKIVIPEGPTPTEPSSPPEQA